MKKIGSILILIVIALFSGSIVVNVMGDENYYGEDGEQPGIGVDTGPGEQNTEMIIINRNLSS